MAVTKKHAITIQSYNLTSEYRKEFQEKTQRNSCTSNFTAALFTIAKDRSNTSVHWQLNR